MLSPAGAVGVGSLPVAGSAPPPAIGAPLPSAGRIRTGALRLSGVVMIAGSEPTLTISVFTGRVGVPVKVLVSTNVSGRTGGGLPYSPRALGRS